MIYFSKYFQDYSQKDFPASNHINNESMIQSKPLEGARAGTFFKLTEDKKLRATQPFIYLN